MYRTKEFTPLFNTPYFSEELEKHGGFDETFHLRTLETILFAKREVVVKEIRGEIATLTTPDYIHTKDLYTKMCYIEKGATKPLKKLPSIHRLLKRLKSFPRIPYLLGGTIPTPLFLDINLTGSLFANRHRRLFGIDCSGLLYYVTEGNVPRNTSDLINIGKEVIDLKPLDLVVYKGHVLIYLGDGKVIESREEDGVVISNWSDAKSRRKDPYRFIRFHPEAF